MLQAALRWPARRLIGPVASASGNIGKIPDARYRLLPRRRASKSRGESSAIKRPGSATWIQIFTWPAGVVSNAKPSSMSQVSASSMVTLRWPLRSRRSPSPGCSFSALASRRSASASRSAEKPCSQTVARRDGKLWACHWPRSTSRWRIEPVSAVTLAACKAWRRGRGRGVVHSPPAQSINSSSCWRCSGLSSCRSSG